MASKLEETELVAGLRSKTEAAYRRLIEEYADKLYRLCFRILRNEEDARETLQDVLTKVVTKIENFQGDSSLYTWLYRVTMNECLMRKRDAHPPEESFEDLLPRYEFGFLLDKAYDWTKTAEQKFENEEFRKTIQDYVGELPEQIRSAYVLKDLEEMSEDEVCDVLQITKATMKNRVHRARLILRKRIEKKYAP